ncbi:MAG: hypothetical protein IPK13_01225 [Deltaproteobacteria bacterium]|nr:hypothetical protein [Deltaproteobacteria bacterium]
MFGTLATGITQAVEAGRLRPEDLRPSNAGRDFYEPPTTSALPEIDDSGWKALPVNVCPKPSDAASREEQRIVRQQRFNAEGQHRRQALTPPGIAPQDWNKMKGLGFTFNGGDGTVKLAGESVFLWHKGNTFAAEFGTKEDGSKKLTLTQSFPGQQGDEVYRSASFEIESNTSVKPSGVSLGNRMRRGQLADAREVERPYNVTQVWLEDVEAQRFLEENGYSLSLARGCSGAAFLVVDGPLGTSAPIAENARISSSQEAFGLELSFEGLNGDENRMFLPHAGLKPAIEGLGR